MLMLCDCGNKYNNVGLCKKLKICDKCLEDAHKHRNIKLCTVCKNPIQIKGSVCGKECRHILATNQLNTDLENGKEFMRRMYVRRLLKRKGMW